MNQLIMIRVIMIRVIIINKAFVLHLEFILHLSITNDRLDNSNKISNIIVAYGRRVF